MRKELLKLIYLIFKHFPLSHSRINLGQKRIRSIIVGKLIPFCGIHVNIECGVSFDWKYVQIGDYSGIGVNAKIEGAIIGKYVLMGPECVIFRRNHMFKDINKPIIFQGYSEDKIVVIEDDVWIGQRVMIMAGVRIGKGCIIAAGSIVTKNFEPFTIIGGVPAKVIGSRLKV